MRVFLWYKCLPFTSRRCRGIQTCVHFGIPSTVEVPQSIYKKDLLVKEMLNLIIWKISYFQQGFQQDFQKTSPTSAMICYVFRPAPQLMANWWFGLVVWIPRIPL